MHTGTVREESLGITLHFDDQGRLHRDPYMGPAVVHDSGTEEWWDHGRRTTFVDGARSYTDTMKQYWDCIPSVQGIPYLSFPTYIGGTPSQYRNGTPSFKVTMYTNRTAGSYAFHPFDGYSGMIIKPNPMTYTCEGVLNDCLKTVRFLGLKSQVSAFERRIAKFQSDFDDARAQAKRENGRYVTGAELRGTIIGWDPRKGKQAGTAPSVLNDAILEEFAQYPRGEDGFTVI